MAQDKKRSAPDKDRKRERKPADEERSLEPERGMEGALGGEPYGPNHGFGDDDAIPHRGSGGEGGKRNPGHGKGS